MIKFGKLKLKDNITVEVSGSKSISNRLLILEHLFENLIIQNLSDSQDTQLLKNALENNSDIIDIHHAGTAMRFLTAYLAIQEGRTVVLTGSERMKQRPVGHLVDALRDLGAEISYTEQNGFPPLKITGKKIIKNEVSIPADVSSQFISALMLIGGRLENGIKIHLMGKITSRPYLEMTLKILNSIGIETQWEGQLLSVFPGINNTKNAQIVRHTTESDWSSASYFYSLAAVGRKSINLKSFRPYSLQGDAVIKEIYWRFFGVNTISQASEGRISLIPEHSFVFPEQIFLDMNDCPDIAQTLCVTSTALKIPFEITGLHTLKVKETDRLLALKNELFKIGCTAEITENSIKSVKFFEPNENIIIKTYDDHRMAMSFAPFALVKGLTVENKNVVAKSYPNFWKDFEAVTEPVHS